MTIVSDEIVSFPDLANLVSSKRLQVGASDEVSAECASEVPRRSKRMRSGMRVREEFDSIADKENWYLSKSLVPRLRSGKVMSELVIELPTDASDYEISDFESSPIGKMYGDLISRMSDPNNLHYNFSVYQDN